MALPLAHPRRRLRERSALQEAFPQLIPRALGRTQTLAVPHMARPLVLSAPSTPLLQDTHREPLRLANVCGRAPFVPHVAQSPLIVVRACTRAAVLVHLALVTAPRRAPLPLIQIAPARAQLAVRDRGLSPSDDSERGREEHLVASRRISSHLVASRRISSHLVALGSCASRMPAS